MYKHDQLLNKHISVHISSIFWPQTSTTSTCALDSCIKFNSFHSTGCTLGESAFIKTFLTQLANLDQKKLSQKTTLVSYRVLICSVQSCIKIITSNYTLSCVDLGRLLIPMSELFVSWIKRKQNGSLIIIGEKSFKLNDLISLYSCMKLTGVSAAQCFCA